MADEKAYFEHQGLKLRPVEERDLEAIRRLRNDGSTWIHLTDPRPLMPADQKGWLESLNLQSGRFYFVVSDAKYPFIGLIRMDQYDPQNRSLRVGADVLPELRGIGYGRWIYDAILMYGFGSINLHRIWLAVLESNAHAIRLYEKKGFTHEGRLREAVFRDGRYVDYLLMSILEQDYRKQ
jgi:RimJ/RimL family protein N-acetyltransferase